MTWYADLTACSYFPTDLGDRLLAVGWLSGNEDYPTGPTARPVYDRLVDLVRDPWQPMLFAGSHHCDLCQMEGASGAANIFVPGDDVVFVAPVLIVHYINAHHYRPPERFCDAVMVCPTMRSVEYLRALTASGLRMPRES